MFNFYKTFDLLKNLTEYTRYLFMFLPNQETVI